MSDLDGEATDDPGLDSPSTRGSAATVTVEGQGVSITRHVDEATMSTVIAFLFGTSAPARGSAVGGSGTGGAVSDTGGRVGRSQQAAQWQDDLTLGEFIVDSDAKTFPQKICAAGYYLISIQGAASFSRDDVRAALVGAHEDMPANFSRDWSAAASSHLIAGKQGEAGQFYVPRTGRTAVESLFSEVPKRRVNRRAPKKAAVSAASGDGG